MKYKISCRINWQTMQSECVYSIIKDDELSEEITIEELKQLQNEVSLKEEKNK